MKKRPIICFILAAVLFCTVLSGCANEAGKSYKEGIRLYGEGKYQEALKNLQLSVSQGNDDPVVYADMALCYEMLEDSKHAAEMISKARVLSPSDKRILRREGICLYLTGDYPNAILVLRNSFPEEKDKKEDKKDEPEDVLILEARGFIAWALMKTGAYEEAVQELNILISANDHATAHLVLAGECYLRLHQFSAADQYFDLVGGQADKKPSHYLYIYNACVDAGSYSSAVRYFEEGLSLTGEGGTFEMTRGEYYARAGRLSEAEISLSGESSVGAKLAEASLYTRNGKYQEAEAIYTDLLKRGEETAEVYSAYMILKIVSVQDNEARELLKRVQSFGDREVLRSALWNEIILLEKECDYEQAYEKLLAYRGDFGTTEATERELLFLARVLK
ncbi:MAG: tetratricopeptide repeat protein [Lachnospiraceae bacterium]|nr:tetratricopeptide repeat protein [Lachnospiraceae bacterium]